MINSKISEIKFVNCKLDESSLEILKLFKDIGLEVNFIDCTSNESKKEHDNQMKDSNSNSRFTNDFNEAMKIIENPMSDKDMYNDRNFEEKLKDLKSQGYDENHAPIRNLLAENLIDSGEFISICKKFYEKSHKCSEGWSFRLSHILERNETLFEEITELFLILRKYIYKQGVLYRCKFKVNNLSDNDKKLIIHCFYYMDIFDRAFKKFNHPLVFIEHPLFDKFKHELIDDFYANTDYVVDGLSMFIDQFPITFNEISNVNTLKESTQRIKYLENQLNEKNKHLEDLIASINNIDMPYREKIDKIKEKLKFSSLSNIPINDPRKLIDIIMDIRSIIYENSFCLNTEECMKATTILTSQPNSCAFCLKPKRPII